MNQPNPAIVAQAAVRRLPRLALLLFCLAYVLPGFLGRDAWKNADVAALGYMAELAQGSAHWLLPRLGGFAAESPALLPYWLGAGMLRLTGGAMDADFAVRIPFALLLVLAMVSTWYASYYLARSPRAQPVAFAFGGEANPKDYARAMADGGLLALIACLGLAQLSHETTPALAQLGFAALLFFALAALPYHAWLGTLSAGIGLLGLGLSGAPTMAALFCGGGLLILAWERAGQVQPAQLPSWAVSDPQFAPLRWKPLAGALAAALLAAAVCYALDVWRWKLRWPTASASDWYGQWELLVWFTWPAWPLAMWTLWQWRRQLITRHISRHLALPLWFGAVTVVATWTSDEPDRTLLLALPALASLAAFALPTLKRQVAALIDWFTLIFFSGCGFIIWVVWIASLTGVPSQPAANVERLAPGFVPSFSLLAFVLALLATLVWAWLVHWRVGRHRAAIWKSLVLPAGGAALCWLLLMTLWMPLLNHAQSFTALVKSTLEQMDPPGCVETLQLGQGKTAAFQVYGDLKLQPLNTQQAACPWLLAEPGPNMTVPAAVDLGQWTLMAAVHHPTDGNENVLLFRRH